jgi:hypothetical protein
VVSSCPWKIEDQVTTGVQITLARENYISLKNQSNDKQRDVPFSNIRKKNKIYYSKKNTKNNYNKLKTEIKKNKKEK